MKTGRNTANTKRECTNALTGKLRALTSMMFGVRGVVLIATLLIASGLGVIGYIHPRWEFDFEFSLGQVEVYWRAAPLWLLFLSGLCVAVLLLAVWWQHRKRRY